MRFELTAEILAKSSLIASSTAKYYSVLFKLVVLSVDEVRLVSVLLLVTEVFVCTPSKKLVIISYLSNVSSYREAGKPVFKVWVNTGFFI